jgi:hypothetical protein
MVLPKDLLAAGCESGLESTFAKMFWTVSAIACRARVEVPRGRFNRGTPQRKPQTDPI